LIAFVQLALLDSLVVDENDLLRHSVLLWNEYQANGLIIEILIAFYPTRYINHSDSEADLEVVCYVDLINAKNNL
jgi:hypothetical protein